MSGDGVPYPGVILSSACGLFPDIWFPSASPLVHLVLCLPFPALGFPPASRSPWSLVRAWCLGPVLAWMRFSFLMWASFPVALTVPSLPAQEDSDLDLCAWGIGTPGLASLSQTSFFSQTHHFS